MLSFPFNSLNLVNDGPDVFTRHDLFEVTGDIHVENDNRKVILFAHGRCR